MKGMVLCTGLLMLMVLTAMAQEPVQINGYFHADSISIGAAIPYSLTARYPRTQQILFPDSTFSFKPFEFSRKKFFATKTTGDTSYDSAVYFLTTFEIDSVQRIGLPVFRLQERDCVTVYARPDSVFLRYRVAAVPDSISVEKLPLKTNTAYQSVKWLFNYPVVTVIVGVLIVGLVLVYILFGKRIRKYFALRRLKKNYKEFIERFNRALDGLSPDSSGRTAEEALLVWKRYMEDLEEYPYTKFTSREIIQLARDQSLDGALRSIDRGIYGGISSTVEPFRFLQTYSQQQFQKKEDAVKNG